MTDASAWAIWAAAAVVITLTICVTVYKVNK